MQEQQSYFDAHTHLLDYPSPHHTAAVIQQARNHGFRRIAVNTTTTLQFKPLLDLVAQYPLVVPSFGVHPLFIDQQEQLDNSKDSNWLQELKAVLAANDAYGVGEIGIDFRTAVLQRVPKDKQIDFFERQLGLGIEMNRPITIHCVMAYGELLKTFKQLSKTIKVASPPLILHSYGGSKDMVKSLLKLSNLDIYFSLSLMGSWRLGEAIPLDRLLCETDAPCQNNIALLEETGLSELNQYHWSSLKRLKELSEELFAALEDKELRMSIKEDESEGYGLMKKILQHETSEPTNLIASTRILHAIYGIEEGAFAKAIFSNACRAFKLLK